MSRKLKIILVATVLITAVLLTACGKKDPADTGDSTNDVTGDSTNDTGITYPDVTDYNSLFTLVNALPAPGALKKIHSGFLGYWTSGDLFVGFIVIDGELGIEYGLYQTSFGARGKITDSWAPTPHEMGLPILIPASAATEMDDAKPERTETISIDISNYFDKRLNIKIEDLGDGEWHTYEFGGSSLADAYSS